MKFNFSGPNDGTNTRIHDSAGRIVEQTDPLGRLTTFQYDAANRLTARESTSNATVTFGYGEVGNAYPLTKDKGDGEQCVEDGLKFSCGHIPNCEKRCK